MQRIALILGLAALVLAPAACNRATDEGKPAASTGAASTSAAPSAAHAYTDQDISDAYIYLLGRLLVLRQQKLDFEEGFKWNEIVHRKPGQVDWPNPNLDVAYSEAWVAVDENSCTIVTVPKITGRYFTVQFLNGWGETVANINERTQPAKPYGDFAVCLKGANVALPPNTTRIDLPVKFSRVLARVELGKNWDDAVKLQQQISFRATGKPALPTPPSFPALEMEKPPGVEVFDNAIAVLDSEADINEGMEGVAAHVRAIAEGIKDPAERARVDQVIREKAWADLAKAGPTIGHGTVQNNWARPSVSGVYGNDWLGRTLINLGGIWANTMEEVVYFKGNLDGDGNQLNGTNTYTLTFPKDALPASKVKYFWSVIAVDPTRHRVLPNPLNRFLLNKESGVKYNADGSLTLFFAPEKPADAPEQNWLPTPRGQDYRLTFRFYGPQGGVADGTHFPPPLIKRT